VADEVEAIIKQAIQAVLEAATVETDMDLAEAQALLAKEIREEQLQERAGHQHLVVVVLVVVAETEVETDQIVTVPRAVMAVPD
jgi:hypothetical protein